jgi:hypothetical protein
MPLFKNHLKKQSVPAPEEPKKGVRQLMAEQESGCEIEHVINPKPEAGKVYEAEYWAIASPLADRLFEMELTKEHLLSYDGTEEHNRLSKRLSAIGRAHPSLGYLPVGSGSAHYASLDDALCALEKATYGFDLSGREAEKAGTQPAPEEPKAAFPNPSIRIEIDPNDMSAHVTADRITFDGRDLSGTYASINKAIAALGKAIADPYAKRKGAPSKKDKH